MLRRYQRWMHDWETRLTTRDTNRVVRPLEWGLEWVKGWPCLNGSHSQAVHRPEEFLKALNREIVERSDEFYAYATPRDFRLEAHSAPIYDESRKRLPRARKKKGDAQFLRFTSAVHTSYPENNLVNARWFPAAGRRAMVVIPQWNADGESHNALCRIFQLLGIASLRLSMPYHDARKPAELERADYAVSSNICRTIDAARQGVADIRSCLDWLESQGYTQLGIMGTSLGSCYAFLAASHDARVRTAAYNHASTYFGDVVWTGQSTRHIRAGVEGMLDQDRLRDLWRAISPMSFFDKYERWPRKSLVIYATYDLTFLPEFSLEVVREFRRRHLDCKVSILPCGHYTTGEAPYKYLDAWYIARFLNRAL